MAAALSVLLLVSLGISLSHITRPFWLDEWSHSLVILELESIFDLPQAMTPYFQPWVEYAIRWVVLSAVGVSELSSRLLSLFWALLAVSAAYIGVGRTLLRWGATGGVAWGCAFLSATWVVTHPVIVTYSVEARHYSFIVLMSVIWFVGVAGNGHGIRQRIFDFMAAGAHFFSWPMLGVDLVARAVLRPPSERTWVRAAAAAVCFFLILIVINRPALEAVVNRPPGAVRDALPFEVVLGGVLKLWTGLYAFIRVPSSIAAIVCLGCIFAWRSEVARRGLLRLVVQILITAPALFLFLRMKSDYGFAERYHLVWAGLVPALAIVSVQGWRDWLKRLAWSSKVKRRVVIAMITVSALALVPTFACKKWTLALPEQNFSTHFRLYESALQASLAGTGRLVVIGAPCYSDQAMMYYWAILGGARERMPSSISEGGGHPTCWNPSLETGSGLVQKLEKSLALGETDLILHQIHAACPKDAQPHWSRGFSQISLDWASGTLDLGCVWLMRGARAAQEVAEFARSVGFPKKLR